MTNEVTAEVSARDRWLVLAAAFLGWMFDGLEMGLFPLVARPALQDLMHVTDDALVGPWIGQITACFLFGAAAGGLVFGWLGDRVGRVRAMAGSVLAYSVFTGCSYWAAAPWQLGLLRFLAALGMGGEWALGVALVMECWPAERRPLLAGVIGAASNFGFLTISLVGVAFPITVASWRWMMLAGAGPAVLALVIMRYVPESQRWRQSVARGPSRPLAEIFSPPLARSTLLAVAFASIALVGTWGAVSGFLPVWVDRLAPGNPYAKATTQAVASVGSILGCFLGALIGGRFGRRPAYFAFCLASLVSSAFLFRGLSEYNALFLATTAVVGFSAATFYGWLPLYLPELFPTRVRATGQGLSFNFGRIFAALGALGSGQLVAAFGGDYGRACATITLVYALGLVLIWLAPETKGRPLPE